ncbi:MAG: hypothetical protein JST83_02520 [Bacteroidetes bacterium]|nr:hypothetical protein [Bacteroidota bacterium]
MEIGEYQYPDALIGSIKMEKPNESIVIYDGAITIKCKGYEFSAEAKINFVWQPIIRLYIEGTVTKYPPGQIDFSGEMELCEIFIDGVKFGESATGYDFLFNSNRKVEGSVYKSARGDKSKKATTIRFGIPNFKLFGNDWIYSGIGKVNYPGRLVLKTSTRDIILDQSPFYDSLKKELSATGGYVLNYNGEIREYQSALSFDEVEDTMFCLSLFLSFLNGSFTCPLFWDASIDQKFCWTHYDGYKISPYKYSLVRSWADYSCSEYIPALWSEFAALWENSSNKNVLKYAIRWYAEANNEGIYGESKTMIVQAALELICNWFLVENKKIVIGKDMDSISAAGKLRILLSNLKIDMTIPSKYAALLSEAKQYNYEDGPDAFVQIRNAIVHSQAKKRERLARIEEKAKWQALQLGLWYLELSLLAIFKHNGHYHNRTTEMLEIVPWANSPFL